MATVTTVISALFINNHSDKSTLSHPVLVLSTMQHGRCDEFDHLSFTQSQKLYGLLVFFIALKLFVCVLATFLTQVSLPVTKSAQRYKNTNKVY